MQWRTNSEARPPAHHRSSFSYLATLVMVPLLPGALVAQQNGTAAVNTTETRKSTAEIAKTSSQDETPIFRTGVNLVVVPVVVRNAKGEAIGSLKREDFQILDNGKPQAITRFSVEQSAEKPLAQPSTVAAAPKTKQGTTQTVSAIPAHFFAYLFDDVHLGMGDLMQVRLAAKKHLETGMGPADRAAIFTTSGDIYLDFTDDKATLSHAMDRIKPRSISTVSGKQCPYMNYHLAQTIVNEWHANPDTDCGNNCAGTPAWNGATDDDWNCDFSRTPYAQSQARNLALQAALREVQLGDADTHAALTAIKGTVRRLAAMPGSRTLILVSPGFLTGDEHYDENEIVSLATKSQIVINALDARGLYTYGGDASGSNTPSTPLAAQLEASTNREASWLQTNVMVELTGDTGGKFFHNNNDLFNGFNQLASPPRFLYILAFSPKDLKQDGRFHHLKVMVANSHGLTVQARRGYYESNGKADPQKAAAEELENAFFSRQEVHTVPIALNTEYYKPDIFNARLSVVTHIDLNAIQFRKVNGSNLDNLTLVCGLFDRNGNYLQGKKRQLSMRLTDETLRTQLSNGINVKTSFDVKPGDYLIRVIVRDSDDRLMSAINGSINIQ